MSIQQTEEYYRKFIELQEKLRKSEEERFKLEMMFNEIIHNCKEAEQSHYKKLRQQYKKFLEEDRKRSERNEKILHSLETIEARIASLTAKTERFKALRRHYQTYLNDYFAPRQVESRQRSSMGTSIGVQFSGLVERPDTIKPYMGLDDAREATLNLDVEKSNCASSMADDIMKMINSRRRQRYRNEAEYDGYQEDVNLIRSRRLLYDDLMFKIERNNLYSGDNLNTSNELYPELYRSSIGRSLAQSTLSSRNQSKKPVGAVDSGSEKSRTSSESSVETIAANNDVVCVENAEEVAVDPNLKNRRFMDEPEKRADDNKTKITRKSDANNKLLDTNDGVHQMSNYEENIVGNTEFTRSKENEVDQALKLLKPEENKIESKKLDDSKQKEISLEQSSNDIDKNKVEAQLNNNKEEVAYNDNSRKNETENIELDGSQKNETHLERSSDDSQENRVKLPYRNFDKNETLLGKKSDCESEESKPENTKLKLPAENEILKKAEPLLGDDKPVTDTFNNKDTFNKGLENPLVLSSNEINDNQDFNNGQYQTTNYDETPFQQPEEYLDTSEYNAPDPKNRWNYLKNKMIYDKQYKQWYSQSQYPQEQYYYDQKYPNEDQNYNYGANYNDESGQEPYNSQGGYISHGDNYAPDSQYGENVQQFDEGAQQFDRSAQQFDESAEQFDASAQQFDENAQQFEENAQQFDENGQPIPYIYQGTSQYDENVQQFDENGKPIPYVYPDGGQYDESGYPIQYDENGYPIRYDEHGQPYYSYEQDQGSDLRNQQESVRGESEPLNYEEKSMEGASIQKSKKLMERKDDESKSSEVVKTEASIEENSEQRQEDEKANDKKAANVMEMLDTDTESAKQDTKVSNDSDFDFSNG